jgi:proteasome accessory factor A
MTERLMGLETEYAFVAFHKDGSPANARLAMTHLEQLAERSLPHLRCNGQRGIFLQNGSRFYRDYGGGDAHQEMTTPECPNPWDVVRYMVANERILVGLAGRLLQESGRLGQALYFKHNVDYSGSGASWGSHESYLTRTPVGNLGAELLPHLVSRIVFTGAGGFNAGAPPVFMLSPRVSHLSCVASLDTEHNRPIFNLRDESLSQPGYYRLHVICGESLSSHTSLWLRFATTALVVALADGGVHPGKGVMLVNPLGAMRAFACDPACQVTVPLHSGAQATAIQIQRHYLQLAEAHVGADFMPPWTPQACEHWRAMLDRLERGAPDSIATTLDWAIKHALFRRHLEQKGLEWAQLRHEQRGRGGEAVRQQLYEMDIRYGQLGEGGIFSALDRAGVLHHQFPGVDNFEHAMIHPPSLGRARLRGAAIRRMAARNEEGQCDWMGVWNLSEKKFLDLSEPFPAVEKWRELRPPSAGESDVPRLFLQLVERHYHEGCFEHAAAELEGLETLERNLRLDSLRRLKALVQARRGQLDGLACLDRTTEVRNLGAEKLADQLFVLRFMALAPRPEIEGVFRCVLHHCGLEHLGLLPASFQEHYGAYQVWCGHAAEGEAILAGVLDLLERGTPAHPRCLVELANAWRLLGRAGPARELLEEARRQQLQHRFLGDLADLTLPHLAKVMADSDLPAARAWLAEAKLMQSRSRNRLGLVRTLLLEARLAARGDAPPHTNEAILALAQAVPSLATCELFNRIVQRWDAWARDPRATENGDVFWGL